MDPLIIAVFSALIGVVISQSVSNGYGAWTHNRKRGLMKGLLETQLQIHKLQLAGLENMVDNEINNALDSSPIHYFLNSDVVDHPKDGELVSARYEHLGNIEKFRCAMYRINMSDAGFTSVHREHREALEKGLKEAIPSLQADLDSCLKEIYLVI